MNDLNKLSIMNLARSYKKKREHYNPNNASSIRSAQEIGSVVGGSILLFALALWIWAIVILVKYWKVLPEWAKVVGILGVLPVVPIGPIVTIVVVYIGKSGHSHSRR
jgi:hypothetical protein